MVCEAHRTSCAVLDPFTTPNGVPRKRTTMVMHQAEAPGPPAEPTARGPGPDRKKRRSKGVDWGRRDGARPTGRSTGYQAVPRERRRR
jgi:hypothetical protein